ncbi:ParB N-terminal domain-containing protein [candidate division KSB1 bacterium]|nr:ParB N-terminal domain-containing protein [candidate division KSB1 bacterium]
MINFYEDDIKLTDIDLKDETYLFSFEPRITEIIHSIQEIGLINPPILVKKPDGFNYIIISGLKRVLALMHLKTQWVRARIIDQQRFVPALSLFRLGILENLGTRQFNVVEKSIIIRKLHDQFGLKDQEIIEGYFDLLNLGNNQRVLQTYLQINKLEDNIKIAIHDDLISPEMGYHLTKLDPDDRNSFFQFILQLKLGKNRQKEFIKLLDDISKRDQIKMARIIEDDSIRSILSREDLGVGLKLPMIRQILRRKRYPILTNLEERFSTIRKKLRLPPKIQIRPPENFEGDTYHIELNFKNQQEFAEQVRVLNSIADSQTLNELDELADAL